VKRGPTASLRDELGRESAAYLITGDEFVGKGSRQMTIWNPIECLLSQEDAGMFCEALFSLAEDGYVPAKRGIGSYVPRLEVADE
jgi:hypothetical protein